MTDKPDEPFEVKSGRAPSYGWVRRKDLDTEGVDAWEMPDGRLYASEKEVMPILMRLLLRRGDTPQGANGGGRNPRCGRAPQTRREP